MLSALGYICSIVFVAIEIENNVRNQGSLGRLAICQERGGSSATDRTLVSGYSQSTDAINSLHSIELLKP